MDRCYWSAIQNDDWIDATESYRDAILKELVQYEQIIRNSRLKTFFLCRSCYYFKTVVVKEKTPIFTHQRNHVNGDRNRKSPK